MMSTADQKELLLSRLPCQPKLRIKGPRAEGWLLELGLENPAALFLAVQGADGTRVVRYGSQEFVIAGPPGSHRVRDLRAVLRDASQVFETASEEVELVVEGADCHAFFAQTCAINFALAEAHKVILTRLAGASCAILSDPTTSAPRYLIWVDPSYAHYLWETLSQIVTDLGGEVRRDEPSASAAAGR